MVSSTRPRARVPGPRRAPAPGPGRCQAEAHAGADRRGQSSRTSPWVERRAPGQRRREDRWPSRAADPVRHSSCATAGMPNLFAATTCSCSCHRVCAATAGATGRVPKTLVSWPRPSWITSARGGSPSLNSPDRGQPGESVGALGGSFRPFLGVGGWLVDPDAGQLGQLLLERHPPQQVLDPLLSPVRDGSAQTGLASVSAGPAVRRITGRSPRTGPARWTRV